MPGIEEAIAELLATPLEDFVAERKRLVAELRAAGDKAGAAELAKHPKPSAPAWALNAVARTQPDAVRAWLDAAEALRAATAAPGPGLRDAMAAHRAATTALLAVVRRTARPNGKPLTEPMLERVRALLSEATADRAAAEALRSAIVTEGARKPRPDLAAPGAAGGGAGGDRPAGEGADAAATAEREAAERAAAEARAELEREVGAAYAAVSAAREELAEREQAATAAAERLEEARRTLHRRESEARAAEDAARDARDAVTEAEQAAQALVEQLRRAG